MALQAPNLTMSPHSDHLPCSNPYTIPLWQEAFSGKSLLPRASLVVQSIKESARNAGDLAGDLGPTPDSSAPVTDCPAAWNKKREDGESRDRGQGAEETPGTSVDIEVCA